MKRADLRVRLTRRSFCKLSSLAAISWGSAGRSAPGEERVLVLLQLTGGNDGLNTVIPYEDDVYHKSRPTLAFGRSEVLRLADGVGLHPALRPFLRCVKEGVLGIVQGVGYPHPSGGHNEAMRDWQTARPGEVTCQTGWLGRVLDTVSGGRAGVPALSVGTIPLPLALHTAERYVPRIQNVGQLLLPQRPPVGFLFQAASECGFEAAVGRSLRHAASLSERIEKTPHSSYSYPRFGLAGRLRAIARFIRAQVGLRIAMTDLGGPPPGGFDTHANQARNHGALLRELAESVAAFVEDLRSDGTLRRVLLMTFSEFGRTVAENGRHGTGHGSAAPVFIAGEKIRPGLIGAHPSVEDRENGGLRHHTDFRRLYATVLGTWLNLPVEPAVGRAFRPLPILRA